MSFLRLILCLYLGILSAQASGSGTNSAGDSDADDSASNNPPTDCYNSGKSLYICDSCLTGKHTISTADSTSINTEECRRISAGDSKNSFIDGKTYTHHHFGLDYYPGSGSDCSPCGSSSSTSNLPSLAIKRIHRFRNMSEVSNFGPGIFMNYDISLTLFEKDNNTCVDLFDPNARNTRRLFKNNSSFLDIHYEAIGELKLYDINDVVTTNRALADRAELITRVGNKFYFDIVDIQSGSRHGRLTKIEDRNGYCIDLTYKTWTAQELIDFPDRALQLDQITDAHNRTATFTYLSSQKDSRWVISSIALPNGSSVTYNYGAAATGNLESVSHPDGTTSTFTSSVTSSGFTKIDFFEAAAKADHRKKSVYFSSAGALVGMSNDFDDVVIYTQASMLIRYATNGDNEVSYLNIASKTNHTVRAVYEGQGRLKQNSLVGTRTYKDGWTFGSAVDGFSGITGTVDSGIDTNWANYSQNRKAIPPFINDTKGRRYDYEYNSNNSMTKKTWNDATYEEYSYNSFQQVTRHRDRLGRVTHKTYDSRGNLLSRTVGLKEVGGSDITTLETATYTNEYYPQGPNEYLLRYAFDANTNRTEFIYDTNNQLIQVNEPDDTGTGFHTAQTATFDSSRRQTSSTDATGRTTTFAYDSRDRLIKATYNDNSTELTIYGTGNDANLVTKRKDRNGNVTKIDYDATGRPSNITTAYAVMNDDGTSETLTTGGVSSIRSCSYLDGSTVKQSCTNDGDRKDYTYDYRHRPISTSSYADANSTLVTSTEYVDNLVFERTDAYGRKSYYSYRSSDYALIRTVQGTVPSFSLADFAAVDALTRDLTNNADYLITDYVLDVEGQTTAIIDPRNIRHATIHDSRGRIILQMQDVYGSLIQVSQMIYDANSNVIEVRNPRYFSEFINDRTTNTYTRRNLIKSRTVAAGSTVAATESFTYYDDKRAASHTDFRGNTSYSEWHECCGRFQAGIDQAGHASVSNTDFYGNVTHTAVLKDYVTADMGGTATQSEHNVTDAKTIQEVTTRFDERHRPIARTIWLDKLGNVQANDVPIAGDAGVTETGLTSQTIYFDETTSHPELAPLLTELSNDGITFDANADGSAVISINPEGEVSVAIADGVGRTVASGMYDKDDYALGTYTLVTWKTVTHDNVVNGLLETKTTSALGFENKGQSDGAGRTIKTIDAEGKDIDFEYDANSNLVKSRDANGVGQDCVFDNLNRDTSCTDTKGDTTSRVYNLSNAIITATDAKSKSSTVVYDERNRTSSMTDRINGTTTYTYDDNNNQLSITDALSKVTSYEYDVRNLNTKVTYEDTGTTLCSYDALRRKDVCTDQISDTVTYNYDLASRLLTREYHLANTNLESTDTFTYDDVSRLLTANKGRYNNTCSYTYDEIGRRKTEKTTVGGSDYTVTHTYDADNRVTNCAYPAANNVAKEWTDRNQLKAVDFNAASIIDSTYDAGMRESTRTFGNALVNTMTYNLDNTRAEIALAGKSDLSFTYTYDANKNVTAETSIGTVMDDYSFDASFDEIDRVTQWDRDNATDSQTWTLDLIGNWGNTTGSLGGSSFNENRTHNGVHELTNIGGNSVTYDDKGNMTLDANGTSLVWDIDNHLKSHGVIDFTYDALGRRLEKDNGIYSTLFICDGQRVIEEYEDSGSGYALARSYIYGTYVDDVVAKVEETGSTQETLYYHSDRQFNVRGLTDSSGDIVELYAYSVYGKRSILDGLGSVLAGSAYNNNYGYTGRYKDIETGLWYFRARYFSDQMGRFINRDPLGYVDGMSLYNGYFAQEFGLDPSGKSNGTCTYSCTMLLIGGLFSCTRIKYNCTCLSSCPKWDMFTLPKPFTLFTIIVVRCSGPDA